MDGSRDRDYQLLGRDFVADLLSQFLNHLRLDAKENDVCALDCSPVVSCDCHAKLVRKIMSARFVRDCGADPLGQKLVFIKECFDENASHFACAENCNAALGKIILHKVLLQIP